MQPAIQLVWTVQWVDTWIKWGLLLAWIAIRVIFNTLLEHPPAKNVLKTRSPTSVDGRFVILAKLVKEVN